MSDVFLHQNPHFNLGDRNGWKQFHYYAENGDYEMIKLLADRGTNIHLTTNDGKNCLHIATLNGHLRLCKVLINSINFDVNITDNEGLTALHCSIINGSYKLVRFFKEKVADLHIKTKSGKNCLHIAALEGNWNLCEELINKHNFNVCMADNYGFASTHFASCNGSYK